MPQIVEEIPSSVVKRLPSWFKQDLPDPDKMRDMKHLFRNFHLHTVCESAHCPNTGKCWGQGVAAFMILGEICTRSCRFCAVKAGHPVPVDSQEPRRLALAVKELNLRYAVITSVSRDDLPDRGAGQFRAVIDELRRWVPLTKIEVLTPDFSNKEENLKKIAEAAPEVIGHNIETVRRLSLRVRPQADYDRSLEVLKKFKQLAPDSFIKSGFMVGLGETRDEVFHLMKDLRETGCHILTIGQYLAPARMKRHVTVERFVVQEEFEEYKRQGLALGFKHVMSGPLVRSSYIAEEGYRECYNASS